jgi:hypothetical protein
VLSSSTGFVRVSPEHPATDDFRTELDPTAG